MVLLDEAEAARVREQAAALGVEEPVRGGQLRREGGRCVFLGPDALCRIHARWGLQAKPHACQQFPMIALRAEEGARVGLDPACYTAVRTWREGPLAPPARLLANPSALPPAMLGIEAAVLDVLAAADSVGAALCALVREPAGPDGLPVAFVARWLEVLASADLGPLVDDADTAPVLGGAVRPIARATWDPAAPPPWPALDAAGEAWALEAARRVVWLRLGAPVVHPSAVALLALGGALAAAWTSSDTPTFGWRLAGWLRALRAPNVVARILPDPARLRWLVTGG